MAIARIRWTDETLPLQPLVLNTIGDEDAVALAERFVAAIRSGDFIIEAQVEQWEARG